MVKAPLSLLKLPARFARLATVAALGASRPPHATLAHSVRVKVCWHANDVRQAATRMTRLPQIVWIRPPALSVF